MNWKKIRETIFKYWILPWGACYFMVLPIYADDNEISLTQSGDISLSCSCRTSEFG